MEMFKLERRESTNTKLRRNVAAYEAAGHVLETDNLPATPNDLMDFMAYGVSVQKWDSSTILNMMGSVKAWHKHAIRMGYKINDPFEDQDVQTMQTILKKHYKKPSSAKLPFTVQQISRMFARGGTEEGYRIPAEGLKGRKGLEIRRNWHFRICFTLLLIGMLRQNAAAVLIMRYDVTEDRKINWHKDSDIQVRWDETLRKRYVWLNVDADKNVDSSNARESYMPDKCPGLGCYPVEWLEFYVLSGMAPPSGDFLCRAPIGHGKEFYPLSRAKKAKHNQILMGYQNWSAMIQRAYERAFPHSQDKKKYGSHSGRKSLAQALWDLYRDSRLIADIGGWAVDKRAIDLYFKTSRHVILKTIAELGV